MATQTGEQQTTQTGEQWTTNAGTTDDANTGTTDDANAGTTDDANAGTTDDAKGGTNCGGRLTSSGAHPRYQREMVGPFFSLLFSFALAINRPLPPLLCLL